jgi:superfamily I DNA/RNA helicase
MLWVICFSKWVCTTGHDARRWATDGVQLTLAGPGSGKTSTLTGRFVHLIRRGVDPARILAVSFTKKAADEIRRRIVRLLECHRRRAFTPTEGAGPRQAQECGDYHSCDRPAAAP